MNERTAGRLVKKLIAITAVAGTIALAPALSQAASTIHFDQTTDGGTLSYGGTGGNLIGSDIVFDEIFGTDTPLNAGIPLECVDCVLNFESGPNTVEGAVNGAEWEFSGGGTFTITGEALDSGANTIASGELLKGSFAKVSVSINSFGSGLILFLEGFGADVKHPGLLDFYGIQTNNFNFGHTEILSESVSVTRGTGAFRADVSESDVINMQAVPEPGSLLLLGAGLLGLGAFTRRQHC